jgi:DNA-binding NarL/FixJ family response regulator
MTETAGGGWPITAQSLRRPLSHTEKIVLNAIVAGKATVIIAKEMDRAEGTISAHTRNICAKLGFHTRAELIEYGRLSKAAT